MTPQHAAPPHATEQLPVWHKTACILCECNCGLEIQTDGRRLAKIRGDKDHPASQGYTCEKPLRLDRYQNSRDRITSPLRRKADGTYEQIDWDTAITEIADRLATIKQQHGGDKIFFYSGGGQGNHLPAAYGQSLRAFLGAKYYSNALAQEKTGEMWVDGRLYGGHTKGDFEHAEVVFFVGKNPWQSHSFPRARPTLKEIAADENRSMIVLDPVRTETAALADFHLQVTPGTDAWCLAAMLGILVEEDLLDHTFIAEHTTGAEAVIAVLKQIPVADFAARCGVPESLLRAATRRFATAPSATTYEDLGIQQAPYSTLSSYLNKLLWILTGNFGRPGTMYLHSSFASLVNVSAPSDGKPRKPKSALQRTVSRATKKAAAVATSGIANGLTRLVPALATSPVPNDTLDALARALLNQTAPLMAGALAGGGGGTKSEKRTPVTGARIVSGLVPCNAIADEILTDHPDRFRAMWIDSSNPAHSLADSTRFAEAMRALDLTVVVDVAFTETARLADYVLPASSQFEKWEATFFNFEFPHNVFQLRAPVLDPLPGTLPEPEIYARVLRRLNAVDESLLARLRKAADAGRDTFALAFFAAVAADPTLMGKASYVLYETLGPTLPDGARSASALWGVAQLCALANREAVARAGFDGPGVQAGQKLFEAVLATREGVTFTSDRWEDVWHYVRRRDRRFTVALPDLLEEIITLGDVPSHWTTDEFPFVLSAGERRAFTANTIIRNPEWRRRDGSGALRMSPDDADRLGLVPGDRVRITTIGGSTTADIDITDVMQPGHVSLPNGLGVDYTDESGERVRTGVAPNTLTRTDWRDKWVGTPWHKHVPARIERLDPVG